MLPARRSNALSAPPPSDECHNAPSVKVPVSEFEALRERAMSCVACPLAHTRTQVVFGVGDVEARLMLVGEAPGQNEDLQGEPFVGAAGRLLDELLAGIGISRSEAYIANVIKCRPPGNRDPRPEEIDSCKGYLREQIRMIGPEVVVTLGNFATKLLLRTETGITRLRGVPHQWWLGAILIPTFHPAAALRGGDRVTDQMREDFALARRILDEAGATPAGGEGGASDADQAQLELFA